MLVRRHPADDLVFFVAPVGTTTADSNRGGHFGIFDTYGNNPLFAVEFDIYVNDFDPSFRQVGIDVGSCISNDDAILGQEVTARISYAAAMKLIRVEDRYDLSTLLPQQVQVGLAGTTGMSVAVHDIISWSFRSELRHVKKA